MPTPTKVPSRTRLVLRALVLTVPALLGAATAAFCIYLSVTEVPSPFSWLLAGAGLLTFVAMDRLVTGLLRWLGALFVILLVATFLFSDVVVEQGLYGFTVGITGFVTLWAIGASIVAARVLVWAARGGDNESTEDTVAELDMSDADWDGTEPILVGLCGYAGAGKDTAAKGLLWQEGWSPASYAEKLKDFTLAVNPLVSVHKGMRGYDDFNVSDAPIIYVRYADYVEKVGPELAKENPEVRALLQRVGTDAGRDVIGTDVWVDAAMADLPSGNVVFTDLRFPNEAHAIQDAGGYVIRITRPGTTPVNGHSSETALDDYPVDAVVKNDGDMKLAGQRLRATVNLLESTHIRRP